MNIHLFKASKMRGFLTIVFFTLMNSCGSNADSAYDELLKKADQLSIKNNQIDTTSYDKVMLLLDSAIVIIPQRTEAYSLKNSLLIAKKKYDKAIINNYRLIAQYPDNPLHRMNYGYILKLKGDSLNAQKEFYKALFLNQHALAKSKEEYDKVNLALQRVELLYAMHREAESEKLFASIKEEFKDNITVQNIHFNQFIEKLR